MFGNDCMQVLSAQFPTNLSKVKAFVRKAPFIFHSWSLLVETLGG